VLSGVVACVPTDPIPEAERQIVVEAVLDLGTSMQVVSIREIGGNAGTDDVAMSGASVSITASDGTVLTAQESAAPGIYFVDLGRQSVSLISGGTYTLRVVTALGQEVTGMTTIPQTSPVAIPAEIPEFSRSRDTLRGSWPRVPGAKSYYVSVNARLSYAPGYSEVRYAAFVDTAIALHGTIEEIDGGPAFTPYDTATVVVGAVDDNFYTYYHANVDPFAGIPPSRLQGALGFFGSIVPIYRRRVAVVE
jgi:hypothetical protein